MKKIIIAGSRGIDDWPLVKRTLDILLAATSDAEVVSGGARGVDAMGEQYAEERGWNVRLFVPDWKMRGKAAGPIRNREMAEYADMLIAFWDGRSPGTANMIDEARAQGLELRIVRCDKDIWDLEAE